MTGFQEAVNWFYRWEGSAIEGTDLAQRLSGIFNPAISETDREQLLGTLVIEPAQSSRLPELQFQIGVRYHELGLPAKSLPYLSQALDGYLTASDLHHLTSIRWLYGLVLRQVGNRLAACLHWRQAVGDWTKYLPLLALRISDLDKEIENVRLAILRCVELQEWHRDRLARSTVGLEKHRFFIAKYQVKGEYLQQKRGESVTTRQNVALKNTWYHERLEGMAIALAGEPEEAYLQIRDLAQDEPERVSQGFITQRTLIENQVEAGNLAQVIAEVDRLLAAAPARTALEKAESYLVGGWALAATQQVGWEEHLKKALFFYPPKTSARVWARWLLGGIQWGVPGKNGEAANNWRIALSELTHLKEQAEWHNQPLAVNAYVSRLTAMQAALVKQGNNLPQP